MVRQIEALPAGIVTVEAALEVASDRAEAPLTARAHADRVQLDRGHAVVVHEFPELWQMLHEGRDDLLGRADIAQGIGNDEGLEARQRVERNPCNLALVELLDVHASHMGQRHGWSAELGRIRHSEIDFVLSGNTALEGDAIRLRKGIPMPVLGEIEAFLFRQSRFEISRLPDQARFALLADPTLEDRFDKDQPVTPNEVLDFVLGGAGP